MLQKMKYRFLAAFLALAVLGLTLTACGIENTPDTTSHETLPSIEPDTAPQTEAEEAQTPEFEQYYYSLSTYKAYGSDEYAFLYGLARNDLATARFALNFEDAPLAALPEGVTACEAPSYYYETFAGYGLLAGILWQWDTMEMQIDISYDDGASWEETKLPVALSSVQYIESVSFGFTSATDGWIALYCTGAESAVVALFATSDSGKTWRQTSQHTVDSYGTTLFTTASHGFMGAHTQQGGPVLETWDGGQTWQNSPVVLPDFFSSDAEKNYVTEFVRNEQGYYCILYALLAGAGGEGTWRNSVKVALVPEENGETTTWRVAEEWMLAPGLDVNQFMSFIGRQLYYPDYHGVETYNGDTILSHNFEHYIESYVQEYAPQNYTETEEGYVFSSKLVGDLLALVYNYDDFDPTPLANYYPDADGFKLPYNCGHGGIYQDAVYHSVKLTPEGDIELVRDVQNSSEGPAALRASGYALTEVQRCVFRPITSASGAQMYTLLECERLEDYPLAAK